jgi:hypothetical protein
MTPKRGLQRGQQRQTLFAERGQVASNARKGVSTRNASKAAGDFLLHLDHAQISLGQIIVKIHTQIFQKAEDGFLLFAQAIEQIARVTLCAATAFARGRGRSRVKQLPFIEQSQELRFPIHDFPEIQTGFSQGARLVGGFFHLQQQRFEVGGPAQSLLFEKHEIAQQMHDAQGMLTVVQEVRGPAVVNRDAGELRQNPDGFQGGLPPTRIDVIVGEGRRAGHMHPVPLACHIQPSFILMDDLRVFQGLAHLLLHRGQLSRTPFDQLTDGALTHLHAQQVPQHFTGTGQGQQVLFDQVHGGRAHLGSLLQGSLHSGGKGRAADLLAGGTPFLFGPIFLHHHPRRRHIHHLTSLSATGGHRVQVLLAGLTHLDVQLDDLIWRGGELQARSRVSRLPARFLPALLAQAFRVAHKAIRGGRQAAIVAIFRQLILQVFHFPGQTSNLFLHLLHQQVLLAEQSFLLLDSFITLGHLFTQALIFFFNDHAFTLLDFSIFGKSPANLGSYNIFYI